MVVVAVEEKQVTTVTYRDRYRPTNTMGDVHRSMLDMVPVPVINRVAMANGVGNGSRTEAKTIAASTMHRTMGSRENRI